MGMPALGRYASTAQKAVGARVSLDRMVLPPPLPLPAPPMLLPQCFSWPAHPLQPGRRRYELLTQRRSTVPCDSGAAKILGSKLGPGGGAPSGSSLFRYPCRKYRYF